MFAAGKTSGGGAPAATVDAQFNYVTMLLHGDGTNGAQNNTFLDGSTNNYTITRNGNTTQGSFSPYGSNWSNVFNGSNAYLSSPADTALNMGTGNWTIECWVYVTSRTLNYPLIFGNNNGSYSTGALAITNSNADSASYNDKFFLAFYDVGTFVASGPTNSLNTWYHLAVVRNGTNISMYRNGSSVISTTISAGITFDWGKLGTRIGGGNWDGAQSYFNGNISNLRVIKGTALYTSTFTPSTTPLTAISGTSLLTCADNRFIDDSTNNFTITASGSPSVQRFNPFGTATAYSTATIGGSGYFDGSGDTLTTSTSQIIPSGSFTVECWAYVTGSGNNQKFVAQGTSGSAGRFSLGIEGGNWFVQLAGDAIQTGTPVRNQWNYVAVTYNGSTINLYINGTSIATVSSTANAQNTTLTIGQDWNSYITTGYISDVRISNTVRTISVPTAPYSSDGSTRILLSMTNGAIFDNAMMNDLETVGNAQISTSVVKYGTGSLYFDGTGDYLKIPSTPNFAFGTGDFTIEFWWYPLSSALQEAAFFTVGAALSSANAMSVFTDTSRGLLVYSGGSYIVSGYGADPTLNAWNHMAVTRTSGTLRTFVNGIFKQSASFTNTINAAISYVGYLDSTALYDPNGYIDDMRITTGYSRYPTSTNFTPPTAAFPNTGPY
jgi:hypothetical protein